MAGTFNNTTGYLDVTGVYADEIVVNGKYSIDSDWVMGLIAPAIAAEVHLDSEAVQLIANTVRLNDLIDSDQISTIAAGLDTAISAQIATNTAAIATNAAAIATLASTPGDINGHDVRISALETEATTQDTDIAANATDVVALKTQTGFGTDINTGTNIAATSLAGAAIELDAEVTANTTAIGTLASLTTTDKSDLVAAINELVTTNTALTARVAALEADNLKVATVLGNALVGTVDALELGDLNDVNVGTPTNGNVLTYNGTSWVEQ